MKNIRNLFIFLLGVALFTSCISEDPSMDPDDVENVVEFYAVSDIQKSPDVAVHPMFEQALNIQETIDMNIIINYAGAHVAPEDLTVTIRLNNDAVAEYNTWFNAYDDPKDEHEDEDLFQVLPAEHYTVPSYTVTIPKGQRKANFTIKMKTGSFELDSNYAVGFTIQSVSKGLLSANFSTGVFNVKPKNKYDGIYTLKSQMGTTPDRAFSFDVWDWPYDVHLVTTSANSVAFYNAGYSADYTHPIQTLSAAGVKGWSRLGQFTPVFTFDSNDKIVSVTNYYAAPTNGRGAVVDSNGPNEWKSDGSIKATFFMTQPGFNPLQFKDEFVFKAAR